MKLTVSPGNTKLGSVMNVSLTPGPPECGGSCQPGVPCYPYCYAKRAHCRPSVKEAWDGNLEFYREAPSMFFDYVRSHILVERPSMFRNGVGGDIPDQQYLDGLYKLSREFKETRFLAFTKNHDLDFRGRPKNFSAVLSMWPGWGSTKKRLPRAWVHLPDQHDARVPSDAIPCDGHCDTCGLCWDLAQLGRDVVLKFLPRAGGRKRGK